MVAFSVSFANAKLWLERNFENVGFDVDVLQKYQFYLFELNYNLWHIRNV